MHDMSAPRFQRCTRRCLRPGISNQQSRGHSSTPVLLSLSLSHEAGNSSFFRSLSHEAGKGYVLSQKKKQRKKEASRKSRKRISVCIPSTWYVTSRKQKLSGAPRYMYIYKEAGKSSTLREGGGGREGGGNTFLSRSKNCFRKARQGSRETNKKERFFFCFLQNQGKALLHYRERGRKQKQKKHKKTPHEH